MRKYTVLQVIVHASGIIPLLLIVYNFFSGRLGANPIQAVEQQTGIQALTFLMLSLACTPASSILGWKELTQRRKALGNYGFLYASVHVLTFIGLDYGFMLEAIWRDVGNKSYVWIGLAAFTLLLPLAITSFDYWIKRLGKNWKRLHKLVYLISPLVIIHFFMAVKGDLLRLQGNIIQPMLYGGIILGLLALRIPAVKNALIQARRRLVVRIKP
jgi:sulfoxide reductase heme-binding subunit YedZ